MKLTPNRGEQIRCHGYVYQLTTSFRLLGQVHNANKIVSVNKVKNKKQRHIFFNKFSYIFSVFHTVINFPRLFAQYYCHHYIQCLNYSQDLPEAPSPFY